MFSIINLSVLLTIAISVAFCNSQVLNKAMQNENLRYIGSVNGKGYYLNNETLSMNWTMAKAFCQAANLELATAETQQEYEFLMDTFGELVLPELMEFWIHATEGGGYTFGGQWNRNTLGVAVDATYYLRWDAETDPGFKEFCGKFRKYPGENEPVFLTGGYCDANVEGALCQGIEGIFK